MNKCVRTHIFLLLLVAFFVSGSKGVYAQSNMEVFGQNRVQHRKFDWKFFDTRHFRVYHYDKAGRQLGRYVAEEAENNIKLIEKKLGGQFPQRFNIVLYNSYDEYRQTNIGLKDEQQSVGNARAGSLNLVDDKLVVYFTGQHGDLQNQIRKGMARVVMCKMIFGDNFKKMVKNALLLNLPQWVTDGYIAYLVDGWDPKANSEWKGLLDARPGAGFYALAEDYPELAGKAFWKFVAEQYGTGMVKTLLYTMQQKASVNFAMKDKMLLNMKVTKAYDSCIKFYKNTYALDAQQQEMPDSTHGLTALEVPKDNSILRNILVSPRGSDVCYVAWRNGEFTVCSQKTSGAKQTSILLSGGQKDLTEEIDPNYPMMAWSNTGYRLAILYKKGPELNLRIYNSLKGRIENYVIPDNRFERVLSIAFTADDDKMLFSAVRKSQTDLYMFTFKGSKVTNITDDPWDDVSPQYISGGAREGILFLSNRSRPSLNVDPAVNELPAGPLNLFFYNTKTKSTELLQCTDIKKGKVSQPIQFGNENFAYLYDSNGVNNKYVVLFTRGAGNRDSAYSVPVTNYPTSILSHQYNAASGDVADVVQEKDRYRVYFHELQLPQGGKDVKELRPTLLSREKPEPVQPAAGNNPAMAMPAPKNADPATAKAPEVKGGSAFQTEFSDTTTRVRRKTRAGAIIGGSRPAPDSSVLTEITDSAYVKMKPSNYRLSIKPDFFSIKLDNTILFTQYQSIATNGGNFDNQALGGLATFSMNELMEDQRIVVGYQIPLTASSSTYFLQYQNVRRRLDWGGMFVRTTRDKNMNVLYVTGGGLGFVKPQTFKSLSTMLQADFSYPLDRVRSLRFHTGLRQDRLIEKVTDTLSLEYNISIPDQYTSISRLEYVFDNTITPATNTMIGSRFKAYGEYLQDVTGSKKYCYNLGVDMRHYTRLYKNVILANRFAYAHSEGTSKVQYLVGGVDNWTMPKRDPDAGSSSDSTYGYQMLATSLRGYGQYAKLGNNFAVLTTEVRIPIVTTFFKRPVQSAVLKNLQLVAFVDLGTAWKGLLPSGENMGLTYSFPSPKSVIPNQSNTAATFTVPGANAMGVGYGPGLRTSLFGYFVRADLAWNIERTSPMFYISLGTDF